MEDKKRLGDILKETEAISDESLQTALEVQRATGGRLGGALLRLKLVDSDILAKALGEQHGVEGVNLEKSTPTAEALGQISAAEALQLGCLPLWLRKRTLAVAVSDPRDDVVLERIRELTGMTPKPFVAPQSAIYRAIKDYYQPQDSVLKVQEAQALVGRIRDLVSQLDGVLKK